MPNLYLLGYASFFVAGTKDQVDDVMSDVSSGWSNMNVVYEEEGISKVIEFRLSDKVSGDYAFSRSAENVISVRINGVIKTDTRASAIATLTGGFSEWRIESISGNYRSISASSPIDTFGLKFAKRAPKG